MIVLLRPAIALAAVLHAVFKVLPLQHKVVFLSRQSDKASRDFKMLADELRARDGRLEVRFFCRMVPEDALDRVRYLGELVRQMYHLATAKAAVVDGYAIPVSVLTQRRRLLVVQMWHALGAVKKFGFQSLDRPGGRPSRLAEAMRMHRNYDVVLCGSSGMVPVFAEAFNVDPAIVKPLGLPRVDYLLSHAGDRRTPYGFPVGKLRERFPRLSDPGKRSLLYVPTHRKDTATCLRALVAAVDPERYNLIVKPHDLEHQAVTGDHVIDATGTNVLDLLLLSDVVVTDYSAVAFEACILAKPLYFYVPDIDQYEREHGLNLDPLKLAPGATSRDVGELLERIEAGTGGTEASRALRDRYVTLPEGRCTDAIAALITDSL